MAVGWVNIGPLSAAVNVRTVLVAGGAASATLTDDRIEPIPEALGRVLASPDQVRVAPAHRSQVRFVVSHADAVEGVAVDQGHLDRVGSLADLVEFASCADRAPKPSKPASQNQDSSSPGLS